VRAKFCVYISMLRAMNTLARGRRLTAYAALAAAFFALAPAVHAHGGGLDASGCHTNRKTGDYHCHRAPGNGEAGPPVKKSRNGICHDRSSPWYDQTTHYVAFETLEACLDSGGRLPKT